jgi:uncharacterized protein YcnI
MLRRLVAAAAVSTAVLLAFAPSAWAHVEIDPEEAAAGATETLTFNVEYEGSPTQGLQVQLPSGATVVDVPDKAGWTATNDEATHVVTWTGGSSTDDDAFELTVTLPTTPGVTLFPSIVTTAEGEVAWIEEAEGVGEEGHPAPRLTIVAADGGSSTTDTTAATSTTSGDGTTTTASDLPGTTLEADQVDDGNTSAMPWVIGSAIAALAAVVIGGLILKRRQDAEKARDAEPPAGPAGDGSADGSGDPDGDAGGGPGDEPGS